MKKILYLVLSALLVPVLSNSSFGQIFIRPVISTYAGDSTAGYSGDGSAATSAQLQYPEGIATDNLGNLYIGDIGNHRIRKVSPDGLITTIGGNGTEGCSGDGGQALDAQLNARYIATDGAGNIYFCDPQYHRVRMLQMSGLNAGRITTIAGNGMAGFAGDGGFANAAQLNNPMGITVTANGTIYVADNGNKRVRMIDVFGGISTIAGGTTDPYTDTAPAMNARLIDPRNLTTDATGNIYLCDGNLIRKISRDGNIYTIGGNLDTNRQIINGGPATATFFQRPEGIVADADGNVFFAEALNNMIRKISKEGLIYQVIRMPLPIGLARGTDNQLYAGEYGNHRIRRLTNTSLSAATPAANPIAIRVFPNPCKGQFSIDIPDMYGIPVQISITNSMGRLLKEVDYKSNGPIMMSLDVPPGIYIVKASAETGTVYSMLAVTQK